jgi:hypothetical protein
VLTTGPWEQPPDPGVIAEMHAYIHSLRGEAGLGDAPFELVVGGSTPGNTASARDIIGPLAAAGATWWDERFPFDSPGRFDAVRGRVEQGHPRWPEAFLVNGASGHVVVLRAGELVSPAWSVPGRPSAPPR